MADVVEQGGVPGSRKVVAPHLQLPRHEGGDVQDAEGVFEVGAARGRVDRMCAGKLLDPPQPLEGTGV